MIFASALLIAVAVALLMPVDVSWRLATTGLVAAAPHRVDVTSFILARLGFGPASRRKLTAQRIRAVEALAALAAELRGGQPLGLALLNAAGCPPVWPATLAALRLDGDVTSALRHDAKARPVLAALAACWQVSSASGSGLSAAVDRLAESARVAEDVRVQLEAQLAGPRATARMLATLPLIGLAMGMLLGADPLQWLLGTPPGLLCLLGGVLLTVAGMAWTSRIATAVERQL